MSRGSVLFIDDQLSDIKYYVLKMEDEGFEVSSVTTIAEGLERVSAKHFDVVVLDVIMSPEGAGPDMRNATVTDAGIHLATTLRKKSPYCKIIVLTNFYQKIVFDWFSQDTNSRVLLKIRTDPFRFIEEVNALMTNKKAAPRIFIVCGRDKTAWLDLKNYLQNRLKFPEPIILAEQGSFGTTVIEKFEKHAAEIDIAFVIMTPDDTGALANSTAPPAGRARQNVIFELGYFMGMLGRTSGRLVVLHKGPLEIASDLAGIIYIDISNGIEGAGEEIRGELQPWL